MFFINDTATTDVYTYLHPLSRHDALPICLERLLLGLSPAPPGDRLGVAVLLYPHHGLLQALPGFLRGRRVGNPAVLQAQGAHLTLCTSASYTQIGRAQV